MNTKIDISIAKKKVIAKANKVKSKKIDVNETLWKSIAYSDKRAIDKIRTVKEYSSASDAPKEFIAEKPWITSLLKRTILATNDPGIRPKEISAVYLEKDNYIEVYYLTQDSTNYFAVQNMLLTALKTEKNFVGKQVHMLIGLRDYGYQYETALTI